MGIFSALFGSKKESKPVEIEPTDYKGFLIYPDPIAESGQFRIAGRICKEFEGEVKTHRFIRSDVLASEADATELMIKKSTMFIDQMGDSIFK